MEWRGVQACVRGRSHERDGTGCDDRALVRRLGDITAVALADGCGSARVGGLAARVAVDGALSAVHRHREEDLLTIGTHAVNLAAEAVRELAHDLEQDLSACSTTLMLAIARGTQLAIVHVGDGVVVGRRSSGWTTLSAPIGGEHANETFVVSDPAVLQHARIQLLDDVTACALLTDGSASSLWERASGRAAPALEKVVRALDEDDEAHVEDALRLQLCPELRKRTMDDCGIAVLASSAPIRSIDLGVSVPLCGFRAT